MRHRLGILLLGLFLAAVPDLVSARQKEKDKEDGKEQLVKVGDLAGTLMLVVGEEKYLAFQYTQQVVKFIPQVAAQNNLETLRRQQEILQNANPITRQQQLMQLAAEHQQKSAWEVTPVTVDLELYAADDFKVRLPLPPPVFDDRGKPRKHTAKELKQLKGPDPKQPGYAGEFDHLKPNQRVVVTLAMRKEDVKKPAAKAPKPKEGDPEALVKQALQPQKQKTKLFVTRVVIVAEPPQ